MILALLKECLANGYSRKGYDIEAQRAYTKEVSLYQRILSWALKHGLSLNAEAVEPDLDSESAERYQALPAAVFTHISGEKL